MIRNKSFFILTLTVIFLAGNLFAIQTERYKKEFPAKASVDISTVSGDCIIQSGSADKISVQVEYDLELVDAFKPDIREKTNSIAIKEKWMRGRHSGNILWTITVPKNTEVEFSSASGDVSVENLLCELEISTASGDVKLDNVRGKLEISTASGDLEVSDVNGEMEFSTASGDIDLKECSGEFDISCASGDIEADDLIIDDNSDFSTASGDVEISLAASPKGDLEISAASGDLTLKFNGKKVDSYIEMTTRKRKGSIRSDIPFTTETEFEKNGKTYLKKTINNEKNNMIIELKTASGDISIKH